MATTTTPTIRADAVVVGAGPAGSAAARFLADAGRDVVMLEKATFPRDKVCGDGLTPRAVKALQSLGLHDEAAGAVDGWARQSGLRMYGGGVVLELPWPEMDQFPAHSITATRALFDQTLATHAEKAGAQLLQGTEVTGPVWLSPAEERIAGVTITGPDGADGVIRAPIVVVADGGSSRLGIQLGLHRDLGRPFGVAARTYYASDRGQMDHIEGFLEMRNPEGTQLPGYGWIFPLDDGTLNVGWGLLNSSAHFRSTNYRRVLEAWVASFPPEWGVGPETQLGKVRSAGLPMAHNRRPHVHKGAVLVGDAGGMVNPFNGEGISYAIEAAELAADAIDEALTRRSDAPLAAYPQRVRHEWGGYYTLGRVFVTLMGNPTVLRLCTELGMPRTTLMQFVFRTMAHLTNRRSRDVTDVIVNSLSRAVPAA